MTSAVAHLLEEAEQLSSTERAELADRLVESLAHEIPTDLAEIQLTEVRRRIAEVETGAVALVGGPEALAQVRQLLSSVRPAQ